MLAPQPPRVRRDFSIAFSERFPGLGVSNNVTAIFIELTATANVQTAVDFATVAFTHGVEGIWLLPPNSATETNSETETKLTKSECVIQCFDAITKTCRGKWVGVRPTHVPVSQQFNWLIKHCHGAGGLWIDSVKIGASSEEVTKNSPTVDPAKGVWQSVTFARAMGTWDGVYFGGITPSNFKRCETVEANENKAIVDAGQDETTKTQSGTSSTPVPNPNAAALKELCVAATFLMDSIIVSSPSELAPARLRCLQDARPALIYAADTLNLDILSEVSPFVEAIILRQSSLSNLSTPNDLGKCLDELMNQPTDEDLASVDVSGNTSVSVGDGQADGGDGGDEKTPSYLEQVLTKLVRVGLSDKRIIFGRLSCVDRDLNLILRDCDEYGSPMTTDTAASGSALVFRRHIGLTMIPGGHISTFAVEDIS
eukprot:m.170005 g.170005  ORF g.170005 m.170005 type:complete len:426 (-) comp31600_c0_seq1:72-1349(-)